MKRSFLILGLLVSALSGFATSTTYVFTSAAWKSQVGSIVCDGTTDGWVSIKNGASYDAGRTWADGRLHGAGIKIEKAQTGAGATSVIVFENVRKVIVDFCVTSNGKGDITVQIGDTTMSQTVNKAMKTDNDYSLNEEVTFALKSEKSGKIKLSVENLTNSSVYIRAITVKADNGSGEVFSNKVYHLVTNVSQLKDSDLIMIGVADKSVNKALGYFDESISKNNIHAVSAKYDSEREYINANEEVTYVLRTAVSEHGKQPSFTIIDPYAEAYLVASGGQTKNALRLWDKAYDPKTYGDYGYWDITVSAEGKATIKSLGNSLGKYIQYNPTFDLFGCYQAETMTAVSIYRQEEQKDPTQPMIVAPLVRFGTVVLRNETALQGSKIIEVKANKLTQDIAASLTSGTVFGLSATTLDRDGEKVTISYTVSATGKYTDTLVLSSGTVTERVPISLTVAQELSIAEAVQSNDFEYIYLNPVTVTKKYDRYVYVRDASGSMMLYDEGPDKARYAKDLAKGHVLRKVEGKFQNYWGVPELHLMAQPSADVKPVECLPEEITACADSADVCRYILYQNVTVKKDGVVQIVLGNKTLPLTNQFGNLSTESLSFTALTAGTKYNIEGIVSYDHDEVVLYPTFISLYNGAGTATIESAQKSGYRLQMLQNGSIVITGEGKTYDLTGKEVSLP